MCQCHGNGSLRNTPRWCRRNGVPSNRTVKKWTGSCSAPSASLVATVVNRWTGHCEKTDGQRSIKPRKSLLLAHLAARLLKIEIMPQT